MKKPNHSGSGQIRIIGGQWRGRKLPVPDSPGLRPTTDRVRETLFNWLAPVIVDAQCLDCFAGSGALGLEALSRYAAGATYLGQLFRKKYGQSFKDYLNNYRMDQAADLLLHSASGVK